MNLWLPAATVQAVEIDRLLLALLVLTLLILALVFALMLRYMVRYRAGSGLDRGEEGEKSWKFETTWTAATLVVFFGLFIWGADLYVRMFQPPAEALKIYVIAKQWMWKTEHAGGQRELNALHVPIGRPVQLVMTSEDVIHDFSVPAFRLKHDVLPGRYETIWFTVQAAGTYALYCTQYCGLDHARMVGEVVALPPPQFAHWLEQNAGGGTLAGDGAALFVRYGCSGCHGARGGGETGRVPGTVRAPALAGLYGAAVPLSNGTVVVADDRYLHDAIMQPESQTVAGFAPIMPSFAGLLGEDDILKLIAYIKSLTPQEAQ
jgi:cytochrome c oxidase subunit 2